LQANFDTPETMPGTVRVMLRGCNQQIQSPHGLFAVMWRTNLPFHASESFKPIKLEQPMISKLKALPPSATTPFS
jgi:hypothetical protein